MKKNFISASFLVMRPLRAVYVWAEIEIISGQRYSQKNDMGNFLLICYRLSIKGLKNRLYDTYDL